MKPRSVSYASYCDSGIYLSGTCVLLSCILTLVAWAKSHWCGTLCLWCKRSKSSTYRWHEWRGAWLGKSPHYDESPFLWSYHCYSHPHYRHDPDGMSIYVGDSNSRERIFRVKLRFIGIWGKIVFPQIFWWKFLNFWQKNLVMIR